MDYKNGKIYKLINDELGLTYYGSTATTLTKRLCGHKTKTNKCKSKLLFTGGAVEIFLVEEFPCENKDQLNKRERFYIENNECVNKNIPGRTMKEWREVNKESIAEQNKEWFEANKEQMKEYNKEYREAHKEHNKEYNKEYREVNKEKMVEYQKEWREANKEKLVEYQKEYKEAHKEKMAEKMAEKFDCECGGKFTLSNRARHLKLIKHLKYSGGLSSN